MGHDFVTFRGRSLHLHDTWIDVLRGLIVRHARPTPEHREAFDAFVAEWICVGSGVWLGDAFDGFVTGDDAEARRELLIQALEAARAEVAAEGPLLSVAFLDAIPQDEEWGRGGFGEPRPPDRLLAAIDGSLALLRP